MTITYPLSLPTTGIESITWTATDTTVADRSPFTLSENIQVWGGQAWKGHMKLPPLMEDDGAEWAGFLAALHGHVGYFLLGDPLRTTPRGAVGGTPVVDGEQSGNTLNIRGATPSVTNWLRRGDYIQLGANADATLHIVESDANSDGSGNVTLDIWPQIRTSPPDGDAVVTSNAKGRFRLANRERSWTINAPWQYGISLAVEELV